MKMEIEWWETCKVILCDAEFLSVRLKKYDKENIVEKSIKDLGDFMKTTEGIEYFSLEAANKAS